MMGSLTRRVAVPRLRRVGAALAVPLVAALALSACNRAEGTPPVRSDGLLASSSHFLPRGYELTSELYAKWLEAQANLDAEAATADLGLALSEISLLNPTAAEVDSVVTVLEANERARAAIESAGLSVREYVVTTLALYQATAGPPRPVLASEAPARPTVVEAREPEIRSVRERSRVRIVRDDRRGDGRGNGKAKGRGKGKGRGR